MNNIPVLTLELANSRKSRRPSGTRDAYFCDPLESTETLHAFLQQIKHPLLNMDRLTPPAADLDKIKILRETLEQIVSQLTDRMDFRPDAVAILNETAKHCHWVHQLNPDGGYSAVLPTGTLAGMLASICVVELANCDASRIKRCCRLPCGQYFYDTTRNRSARWHAENPCGWRTRSERRK